MKIATFIFIGLLISQSAYPQISSGTVIVFQLINNKFMMANMETNWANLMLMHPDIVNKFALDEHGNLTTGVFAAVSHGRVSFTGRSIVLDNRVITIVPHHQEDCPGPCASGMTDIFNEYFIGTTQRAKTEFRTPQPLPKGMSPEMAHIITLVDLTITYDPTHTVGGPVDAVELGGDGSIHWVQKKTQCPEKTD